MSVRPSWSRPTPLKKESTDEPAEAALVPMREEFEAGTYFT